MTATIDIGDYSRQYAEQYDQGGFEPELVRIRRRCVLDSLSRYPHQHVLEVGCGLEPLFPHLEGFGSFTVVEPSAEFTAVAGRMAAGLPDVRVVQGYLEQEVERLSAIPFDFIILSSLLHEVPDPRLLLRAVRDLCGAATVVHLNVPNVRSFHRLLALEMGLISDLFEQSETERRFQRSTRFDLASLSALVSEAGFRVVNSGSYFVKPFTHGQMDRIIRSGIVDPGVVQGLERMIRYLPDLGSEIFLELRGR